MTIRKPTERIQRLRSKIIDLPASICAERGALVTEVYKQYEYLPKASR